MSSSSSNNGGNFLSDKESEHEIRTEMAIEIFAIATSTICLFYICFRNANIRRIVLSDEDGFMEEEQTEANAYRIRMESCSIELTETNFGVDDNGEEEKEKEEKKENSNKKIVNLESGEDDDDENDDLENPAATNSQQEGTIHIPGTDSDSRPVSGTCTICLGTYEVGETVSWSASCNHAFHQKCIIKWCIRRGSPECPICRSEFVNNSDDTDAEGGGSADGNAQETAEMHQDQDETGSAQQH